jgi:signal peptidase
MNASKVKVFMLNKKNKKPMTVASMALSVVQTLLIAALVITAILSFGTKIPLLARMGMNFFAVTSGSMEPFIHTGSVIYVDKFKLEDLKVGDVITFQKSNPETKQSAVVTHRISKIDKKEEKQATDEAGQNGEKTVITYTIQTKGDANSSEDAYTVSPGEIVGVYKWQIPKLGYLSVFAQTPPGFILLVIVPAAILILWEVVSLVLHFKSHYETKSNSEIARLKEELAKRQPSNG